MSADFFINPDHRLVCTYVTGRLTREDAVDHMDRLLSDKRFQSDFRQIIDFTDVADVQLTGEQIRELALREVFGPKSRRAFVVSSNLQFGLARMFGTHRELAGEASIEILRTMSEAVAWVGVPPEIAAEGFEELRLRANSAGAVPGPKWTESVSAAKTFPS